MESNWIFICGKKSYDIESISKVANRSKKYKEDEFIGKIYIPYADFSGLIPGKRGSVAKNKLQETFRILKTKGIFPKLLGKEDTGNCIMIYGIFTFEETGSNSADEILAGME